MGLVLWPPLGTLGPCRGHSRLHHPSVSVGCFGSVQAEDQRPAVIHRHCWHSLLVWKMLSSCRSHHPFLSSLPWHPFHPFHPFIPSIPSIPSTPSSILFIPSMPSIPSFSIHPFHPFQPFERFYISSVVFLGSMFEGTRVPSPFDQPPSSWQQADGGQTR